MARRRGRGEGNIRERPDGTWEARISMGFDGEGRRQARSVYGKSKSEVQGKLRAMQGDAASGQLAEPSTLSVSEYLASWLKDTARQKCSPTTFGRYESLIKLHICPHIGKLKLSKLQPIHVNHLMGEIGKAIEAEDEKRSPAWTQKMALTVFSNALRHAVRLRLIPFNPAMDIPKAKPRDKAIEFWTAEQSKHFLESTRGRRLYALFALALGTGMRQGELLAVRWDKIDFERGTITVSHSLAEVHGKGGKGFILKEPKSKQSRRTLKLPELVLSSLRDHRSKMEAEGHGSEFCFVTKLGTHIGKSNLTRQVFHPALKVAKLPKIKFHALRHSSASMLLNNGASIKAVSRRLGHSSVELTLRVYSHLLPDADDVLAAQVDKLMG
jgi:integrase